MSHPHQFEIEISKQVQSHVAPNLIPRNTKQSHVYDLKRKSAGF